MRTPVSSGALPVGAVRAVYLPCIRIGPADPSSTLLGYYPHCFTKIRGKAPVVGFPFAVADAKILEVLEFFWVHEDIFVAGRKACALEGRVLSSRRRQVLNLPLTFLARRPVRRPLAGLFFSAKAEDVNVLSPS